jgi:4-carboxymuconolactone decarboxylase
MSLELDYGTLRLASGRYGSRFCNAVGVTGCFRCMSLQIRFDVFERRRVMASQQPTSGVRAAIGDVAPKLADLTEEVLFGDIWERQELSKRERSLITVAALIALNRTQQLPFHLKRALDNGITKEELGEVFTHLAFYSGWPTAMSAAHIAKEVFAQT